MRYQLYILSIILYSFIYAYQTNNRVLSFIHLFMHIKRTISKIIFDGNGKNTLRIEFLHICANENITIQNNILHDVSIHHSIGRQKLH